MVGAGYNGRTRPNQQRERVSRMAFASHDGASCKETVSMQCRPSIVGSNGRMEFLLPFFSSIFAIEPVSLEMQDDCNMPFSSTNISPSKTRDATVVLLLIDAARRNEDSSRSNLVLYVSHASQPARLQLVTVGSSNLLGMGEAWMEGGVVTWL